MITGQEDLLRQALTYPFDSIADISGGKGEASRLLAVAGKRVTLTAFRESQVVGDLPGNVTIREYVPVIDMSSLLPHSYDAVWCAHVLEHCPNPGLALAEMQRILKPGGTLFLSVPPYKPQLVGGHISTGWNIGSLIYALYLAGFDVRHGAFVRHGYNIAAFVSKAETMPPLDQLTFSRQDIPVLQQVFPPSFGLRQNIYGDIHQCNWEWKVPVTRTIRQTVKALVREKLVRLAYSLE